MGGKQGTFGLGRLNLPKDKKILFIMLKQIKINFIISLTIKKTNFNRYPSMSAIQLIICNNIISPPFLRAHASLLGGIVLHIQRIVLGD